MKVRELGKIILDFELSTIPNFIMITFSFVIGLVLLLINFVVMTYNKLILLIIPISIFLLYYNGELFGVKHWRAEYSIKITDEVFITETGVWALCGVILGYIASYFYLQIVKEKVEAE